MNELIDSSRMRRNFITGYYPNPNPHPPPQLFFFFFFQVLPFFVLGRVGWEHNITIWLGLVPRSLDLELNPASQQAIDSLTQ